MKRYTIMSNRFAKTLVFASLLLLAGMRVQAQTTVTLPSICPDCVTPEPANVINWKSQNNLCSNATISASGCATLQGAVLNDDPNTNPGIEYDWAPATSTVLGTGFGASSGTRALVEIGGQCWARVDVNIPVSLTATNLTGGANVTLTSTSSTVFHMYNFYTAMNSMSPKERGQGVCPVGFHVPSECEWQYLENTLGMSPLEQMSQGSSRRKTTITLASSGINFMPNVYLGQFNENAGFTQRAYYWTSTALSYDLNWEDLSRRVPYPNAIWRNVNPDFISRTWANAGNAGTGVQVPVRCLRN